MSAGVYHCAASTTALPAKGVSNITVPAAVPAQYADLREVPCDAIYARLMLLNHFSKLISDSWALFSTKKARHIQRCIVARFKDVFYLFRMI